MSPPHPAIENIEAIVRLEEKLVRGLDRTDRVSSWLAAFIGSARFLSLLAVLSLGWILINTGHVHGIPQFDPYPFPLLSSICSLTGLAVVSLVLINQSRDQERAVQRDHLLLQVSLLTEREASKIMEMLSRLGEQLEMNLSDDEVVELKGRTGVEALVREITQRMPTLRGARISSLMDIAA